MSPSAVDEDSADSLVYTFTRMGVISNALTVNFNVGGDAVFGTDYTQTGADTFDGTTGTVTIPAGETTATVTIDPTPDFDLEGDETVVLAAVATANYVVAAPISATGTIINDDSSDLVIDGTGGDDMLVLFQTSGGAQGDITYILNGGAPVVRTGVTSFTFNGLAGNDSMEVIIPEDGNLMTGDAIFNGGDDGDTVIVDAANQQLRVNGDAITAGLGDSASQTITYTGLEATNLNNAIAINAFFGPNTDARDTAFVGLTADQRFVQALYLDVLGRAGVVSELDGWVAVLNSDGADAVAEQIEHSVEGRARLVGSWYQAYLGRTASDTEARFWADQLLNGAGDDQVLAQILGSQEFHDRAQTLFATGTEDERFVQALYLLLLNREGDAAGLTGWVAAVPQFGRAAIAESFLASAEHRAYMIDAFYATLLRRPADDAGAADWEAFWDANDPDATDIRVFFEASDEFFVNG